MRKNARFRLFSLSLMLALLVVSALTVGLTAATAKEEACQLMVGAGKADITPYELLPVDGGKFNAVLDPIYVKVLVVKNDTTGMAYVTFDLTSMGSSTVETLKAKVAGIVDVPAENVFVSFNHNFSSPHAPREATDPLMVLFVGALEGAAEQAANSLKDARVGYGTGTCDVNANRNVLTNQGYWHGINETLPSNDRVGVTRFDDPDGKPIAVIINFDSQSSILHDSQMPDAEGNLTCYLSADLAGAACQHVEDQYGNGVVALWMIGASGDQMPTYRAARYTVEKDGTWWYVYPDASAADHADLSLDVGEGGPALVTVQGERLGTEAVRICETIDTTAGRYSTAICTFTDTVTVYKTEGNQDHGHPVGPVPLDTAYDWGTPIAAEVPIYIWQIGDGVFVGGRPELSTGTTDYIKKHSPFPYTFVGGMFDGGDKNMADQWNYAHLTYAARDGSYLEGAAEAWADQVRHDLAQMYRAKSHWQHGHNPNVK